MEKHGVLPVPVRGGDTVDFQAVESSAGHDPLTSYSAHNTEVA